MSEEDGQEIEEIYNMKLDPEKKDILLEIGNIGSGHAITALSNLLQKDIHMNLTTLDVIPFWYIMNKIGNPQDNIFGILSEIKGDFDFAILQVYSKESIINLINNLTDKKKINSNDIIVKEDLDKYTLSIIMEIGNILAAHYANALADLLETTIIPGVPSIALDYFNAIMNCLMAKYAQMIDYAIIIETKLDIEELGIEGFFCAIPTLKTSEELIRRLKLQYKIYKIL